MEYGKLASLDIVKIRHFVSLTIDNVKKKKNPAFLHTKKKRKKN